MSRRSVISKAALLVVAVIVGIGASELWRVTHPITTSGDLMQYDSDGVEESIQPTWSFNSVYEYKNDLNDDGQIDRWGVWIRRGERFELNYRIDDTDLDGNPDMVVVMLPHVAPAGYTLRDDDGDGAADFQISQLSNLKAKEAKQWYNYYDIDKDGRVDMMVLLEKPDAPTPVENYVLMDSRWIYVDAEKGGNFTDGLYIFEDDDESVHVKFDFDKGVWEKTGDSPDLRSGVKSDTPEDPEP